MSPLPGLRVPSIPLLSPFAVGVAAGVRGTADHAGRLAGQVAGQVADHVLRLPRRGMWERPGRCYFEVRGVHGPQGERVARRVERVLEEHPGVVWARVNAPSERVVVALASPPPPADELIALIERAEAGFPSPEHEAVEYDEWLAEPHHPGEGPRTGRSVSGLAADAVGLGFSTFTRVLPWAPLPAEVAALTGALQRHPRLRHLAAKGLPGREAEESVLPVIGSLTQGVATRGGGLMLDAVTRLAQWREAAAERDAWATAEPRLVRGPEDAVAEPIVVERPEPHRDTAARYAERSMGIGVLAGGLAAPFAGPRRGLAVALSAVPKAPAAGREGFATTLGRFLALRGVVAMDRAALRRLGQVDTVVLEEAALRSDRFEPVDLVPLQGADPETAAERLFALFDPEAALETHRDDDGWVLGPLDDLELTGRTGRQAAGRLRKQGSERVLGLAKGRRLKAVAGLTAQTIPGAEAVAAAARRAGARVILATERPPQQPSAHRPPDGGPEAGGAPAGEAAGGEGDGAAPSGQTTGEGIPAARPADDQATPGPAPHEAPGPDAAGREAPGPEAPGPEAPGREVPSQEAPSREAPGPQVPGRAAPGPQVPGRAAPGPQVPGREAPGREAPGGASRSTAFTFADAVVPAGSRLVASVRQLQADGAVVLLISGNRRALGASDCGIGVHQEGEPPAWGAHLLVGTDLEAAGLIVDAIGVAARVDHDSDVLAAGGSGVGAVAALQSAPSQACARGQAAGTAAGSAAFAMGVWRARQLLARPIIPPVESTPWHLMPADRVLERLGTSAEGLSAEEAADRAQAEPGGGEPPRTTLPSAFVEELANPLTPVLAAGAALAAAVGSRTDAALVAAITSTSALVGGFQRVRTERALADLFARSAIGARVRRGHAVRLVTAGDLVPGDIVVLRPEDVAPADCRLLEAEGLEVDESSLTGESLPVPKDPAPVVAAEIGDRRSMLYEGTTVSAGHAAAVVVATGSSTEVGRSMATARRSAPVTGVEARLTRLTKGGLPVALGSAAAVAGAGLLHGNYLTDTLASAVNLAVASVPEGLPFLVNAAQLAAARRLADHGALVRNPRTIEALGRADVLCFDKTGTLTEGHLQLVGISDGGPVQPLEGLGPEHKSVLAAALRATPPARQAEPMAHHTDQAVAAGARRAKVAVRHGAPRWRRTGSLAFEPSRAYHATAGQTAHGLMLSVKGAPENVLSRCSRRRLRGESAALDDAGRKDLTATAEELAGAGRRILAVAERTLRSDAPLTDDAVEGLEFLGFVTLADPVRTSAAPAAARLREAGVQVVMLTGDHPATADAIAATISKDTDLTVTTGPELDALDDAALDALLPDVDVIARCSPRHKVRIVQAYQRLGRVVAMTGDGANDAPAIRLADIGIALGRRGTPAATAAADLVVGDDRLETIIAALMEGRAMWASVRAALAILIGGNLGEVAFSVLAAALTGSAPLNARQIMLVNLLTDLAPALAIAVREPSEDVGERLLREGPGQSLGAALTYEMLVRGATTTLGAGLAWGVARVTGRQRRASTVALAAVVGTQLAQTLLAGGLDRNVLGAGLGSAAVLAAIIQTPGVSHFFGCTPLGPLAWAIALGAITSATAVNTALTPLSRRLAAEEDGEPPPAGPAPATAG